tara:strand:- start:585 stop:896 length:312 start_codon:yes stop_codon:yes gene_type:complete
MLRTDLASAPGVVTTVALQDGALITGTTQDCTPYAERAQAMSREGLHGSKDMRLAASIPSVLVERYLNTHGITLGELGKSQEHQKRLLNDPALAHFRIWKGRV